MKNLKFPMDFTFKITTFSNDFIVEDVDKNVVAYVKQKMFKFKEAVEVFQDTSKQILNYRINADKWIDFSTAYSISDATGKFLGKVARKGMASIWRAEYDIIDQYERAQFKIKEENPWVKVMDFLLEAIPFVGIFSGYFFHPVYLVVDNNSGEIVAKLQKESSFVGRRFKVFKEREIDEDDAERIVLSLMMMVLLEKQRG